MLTFKRIVSALLVLGLLVGTVPPMSVAASEVTEVAAEEIQEATMPVLIDEAAEMPAAESLEETVVTEETLTETEIQETTADETAEPSEPEETEPEQTLPQETVPEETAVEETLPEETTVETEPELMEMEAGLFSRSVETISQSKFNSLLTAAKKTGKLELNACVTLTQNVTIPENVSLTLEEQGMIIVPNGVTLTVSGGGHLFGDLLVEDGGTLAVENIPLWVHGANVEVNGNYSHDGWGVLYRFTYNGTYSGNVDGVDDTGIGAYVLIDNDAYWNDCLEIFLNKDYALTCLGIQGDVTLKRNLTLDENNLIAIEGDKGKTTTLTIDQGVTLTTAGRINVYENRQLINNGTIELSVGGYIDIDGTLINRQTGNIINNWDIYVHGKLVNEGNITMNASDTIDYYSLLLVYEDGCVENSGSVHCYGSGTVERLGDWYNHDPIYHSLPRPTNLTWHKLVNTKDGTVHNAKGHVYWETVGPANGDYFVTIYNADTDEQVYQTNGQFGNSSSNRCSMPAFFEADPASGNYYFTVFEKSHDSNVEDSVPVRSDVFSYTRPAKSIGKPRNVEWVDRNAVWAPPSDANALTTYEVRWYYSETKDSELQGNSGNFNVFGTQVNMPMSFADTHGAGYYSFKVRALPSDVTLKTVSDWVESETIYYDPDNFFYNESYLDNLKNPNPPGMDSSIHFKHLQQPVKLSKDYALNSNVQLDIAQGGSIVVPAGTTLTLNNSTSVYDGGKLIVEKGGKLIVRQDLWMGFDCEIKIEGEIEFQNDAMAWFHYGQSIDIAGIAYENIMVNVRFDAGCSDVNKMLSFFEGKNEDGTPTPNWGWTILRVEGNMTLPRSVTSPVRSNIYIPDNSSLSIPEGMELTLPKDAQMVVDGKLYNYGGINISQSNAEHFSLLKISKSGTGYNSGRITVHNGGVANIQGNWEGPLPVVNGGTLVYANSFQDFKNEIAGMKQGGTLELTREVVLESSLTIPKNIKLLMNGGRIVVPKGKTLTIGGSAALFNKAQLIVEAGGKLVLNSHVTVEPTAMLNNMGTVTFGKTPEKEAAKLHVYYPAMANVTGISHANQILIIQLDNTEFPDWSNVVELFENNDYAECWMDVFGNSKILLGDLTVPANGTLIINPAWDKNGKPVEEWVHANGKITVYGTMWINVRNYTPCYLQINDSLLVMPGGTLNVCGNVINKGDIRIASGAHYNNNQDQFDTTWEGSLPHFSLSEQDLRDQLVSGANYITLNDPIVLKKSLTIPEGVHLSIAENGSLTVPSGVTLTVNKIMSLHGGSLNVEPRGKLVLNGYIDLFDGAAVTVMGTVLYKDQWCFVRHNVNGTWAENTVAGIPEEHQALGVYFTPENKDYWNTGAGILENSTDLLTFMMVNDGEVTLPRDMRIPENVLVHVETRTKDKPATKLVIPENLTLTNDGQVYVWQDAALENKGTIINRRGFYIQDNATLNNTGTGKIQLEESQQDIESLCQITYTGRVQNAGTVSVDPNAYLLATGKWDGNAPINNGGEMIMGRYAINPNGIDMVAGSSVQLQLWDYAVSKALTEKQVVWSIPEKYAAYATLTTKGKLTASGVAIPVTIEVIGTVLETETEVTAKINLIPAVTNVAIMDGTSVVNGKTVPVDTSEENKTFRVALYPLSLDTDDLKNDACTWTISDTKNTYASYDIQNGVLSVIPNGTAGTVTVKVSCNLGAKAEASFKIQFASYAESVKILTKETTLAGNGKLTLEAAVQPSSASQTDVIWSLENPADKAYVTLSKNSLKAKAVYDSRDIVLVATSKDGRASAKHTITLVPQNSNVLTLKYNGKSVTKDTIYVDLNTTNEIQLKAYLFGESEEAANVKWSSSSKSATVTDGKVKLDKAGSVTITAAQGSLKATVTIKVQQMANKVTVTGPSEVASGKSIQLKAAVTGSASQKVTWKIVTGEGTISTSGKYTAPKNVVSAQNVQIVAIAADGSNKASEPFNITVRPIAQSVRIYTEQGTNLLAETAKGLLDRSNTTFQWDMSDAQNNTLALNADVYPYYGETSEFNAIQTVSWKSSSTKIADVEDGKLVIKAPGSVTITATAADGSGKKASFKLNVVKKVTSLSIDDQTVRSGKSLNLSKFVKITPSDATNKKLIWSIDSTEFATISGSTIRAKKVSTTQTVKVTVASEDAGAIRTFNVTITP